MGYVGNSVCYVWKSVGDAAITHTFQLLEVTYHGIRADISCYAYREYLPWNIYRLLHVLSVIRI